MLTLAAVWTPILLTWWASTAWAWIRDPQRRGTLRRRLRALLDDHRPSPLVDVSRESAARLVSVYVGSAVRGSAYVLLTALALGDASTPVVIAGIASGMWLLNRSEKAANLAHAALADDVSISFTSSAAAYSFPGHRRSWLWNTGQTQLPSTIGIVGTCALLCAGLPVAWSSDALVSPVPGVYIQHTGLSPWTLSGIYWLAGVLLVQLSTLVDRRLRRSTMKQETARGAGAPGADRPAVFLRSFGAENLAVPAHPGPRLGYLGSLVPRRSAFVEDVATWLLWWAGPVVAVSDPRGERQSTVGAVRQPLPADVDWRNAIDRLLRDAAVIVVLAGTSEGVRWEIGRILGDPELASKALVLNSAPDEDEWFLDLVGATPRQRSEHTAAGLRVIGAMPGAGEPAVLCSTAAQDVDLETAVEHFLRQRTNQGRQLEDAIAGHREALRRRSARRTQGMRA